MFAKRGHCGYRNARAQTERGQYEQWTSAYLPAVEPWQRQRIEDGKVEREDGAELEQLQGVGRSDLAWWREGEVRWRSVPAST